MSLKMSRYKFDLSINKLAKLYKMIIMSNLLVPEKIRSWLVNIKGVITPDRLATEFSISLVSARNYLSRLEQEGILRRIARGEYVKLQESSAKPEFLDEIVKIHEYIKEKLPYLSFVIWSISSFKQFLHDIPVKHFIFIEVKERDYLMAIKERLHECDKEAVIEPRSKEFAEFSYKNEFPVILLRRSSRYGCQVIDGIETAILERCIIDIYYHMTRDDLPFAVEGFKDILESAIKAGVMNFSFASRYCRMRNLDFEFDLIFSVLAKMYPELVSIKPKHRIEKFNDVMTSLFGEGWLNRAIS